MTCDLNPSKLDAFVDGELSARERFDLNTHVMQCDSCKARLEELQCLRQSMSTMSPPPMSTDFEAGLKQKIADISPSSETRSVGRNAWRINPLASAAAVILTVTALSWVLIKKTPGEDDLLAMDDYYPVIEIGQPQPMKPDVTVKASQDKTNQAHQIYWSDEHADVFARFTQADDGYRDFNCGSSSGARGCSLGATMEIGALPITSAI